MDEGGTTDGRCMLSPPAGVGAGESSVPARCHVGQDPKPVISRRRRRCGRLHVDACVLGAQGLEGRQRLLRAAGAKYHDGMSLTQLLKHVKALPTRQRERLVREILALEAKRSARAPSRRTGTRVMWPDVEARAKCIVGDRVLPNLVLLERGEEAS